MTIIFCIMFVQVPFITEMFSLYSDGRNTTSKLIKQAIQRIKIRSRHTVIYSTSLWNTLQNKIRKYSEISLREFKKTNQSKYS